MSGIWHTDIDKAPRGYWSKEARKIGKNHVELDVYVQQRVILATKCGKVTLSFWRPAKEEGEGRWNMLAAGEQPVAWQYWPEYPQLED